MATNLRRIEDRKSRNDGVYFSMAKCCEPDKECILKDPKCRWLCLALQDSNFPDGRCHFRKESVDGPNMYDLERKESIFERVNGNRSVTA